MSKASEFYQGLKDFIDARIARNQPFRATITGTVGNKVRIQPVGSDQELGEAYARLQIGAPTNVPLAVGDEVVVITVGRSPFVLGKVLR